MQGPAALTTQLSTDDYIHALNGQDVYDMSVTEVVNSILVQYLLDSGAAEPFHFSFKISRVE